MPLPRIDESNKKHSLSLLRLKDTALLWFDARPDKMGAAQGLLLAEACHSNRLRHHISVLISSSQPKSGREDPNRHRSVLPKSVTIKLSRRHHSAGTLITTAGACAMAKKDVVIWVPLPASTGTEQECYHSSVWSTAHSEVRTRFDPD